MKNLKVMLGRNVQETCLNSCMEMSVMSFDSEFSFEGLETV